MTSRKTSLFDRQILGQASIAAFRKLDPRQLYTNPVMLAVELVAFVATILFVRDLVTGAGTPFAGQIVLWLWVTVLFANFAEAVAEGRGKAQADALRKSRINATAKKLGGNGKAFEIVSALSLVPGDVVLVETGDLIPGDGEVVDGIASVDESAITGESAPVIRESGGDRSAVTGGTRVLSDEIKV